MAIIVTSMHFTHQHFRNNDKQLTRACTLVAYLGDSFWTASREREELYNRTGRAEREKRVEKYAKLVEQGLPIFPEDN